MCCLSVCVCLCLHIGLTCVTVYQTASEPNQTKPRQVAGTGRQSVVCTIVLHSTLHTPAHHQLALLETLDMDSTDIQHLIKALKQFVHWARFLLMHRTPAISSDKWTWMRLFLRTNTCLYVILTQTYYFLYLLKPTITSWPTFLLPSISYNTHNIYITYPPHDTITNMYLLHAWLHGLGFGNIK